MAALRRLQVAISRHHQAVSGSGEELRRTRLHISVKDAIIISQALQTTRNLRLTSSGCVRPMTLGRIAWDECLHTEAKAPLLLLLLPSKHSV